MPRRIMRDLSVLILMMLILLCGCSSTVQYIIQQGIGQISMITSSRPIDQVLASGQLTAEQERKLRLVVAARDFAYQELGLQIGRSYSTYHDTSGEPIGYNLSACRQDQLTSKSWTFPIIGTIDYLGFFSEHDADQTAAELQDQGYDTVTYGVDAYSTLGWFPDPVHSTFLQRSDGSLVETVIHELAHNTIYVPGRSTFNESLATFIGRQGARLFFQQRGEEGLAIIESLEQNYDDNVHITDWMQALITSLKQHYALDVSSEEKIAGREAVFQTSREGFTNEVLPLLNDPDASAWWGNLPTNNAFVLLYQRYNLDLDVFATVYEQVSGDFAAFLDLLRAAAGAADPFTYLHESAGSP